MAEMVGPEKIAGGCRQQFVGCDVDETREGASNARADQAVGPWRIVGDNGAQWRWRRQKAWEQCVMKSAPSALS